MKRKNIILLLLPLVTTNLLSNGDFEVPKIPNGNCESQRAGSWKGTNYNLENKNRMTSGQYIDLRNNMNSIGKIWQQVNITQNTTLTLTFRYLIEDQRPTEMLSVYWDNFTISSVLPTLSEEKVLSFIINTTVGIHILSLEQSCSNLNSNFGFFLDDIELILNNSTSINPSINTGENYQANSSQDRDILTTSENQTLNEFSSFTSNFMDGTLNAYTVVRTSFVSFFLLGTVNFWNLSLMYNMLIIQSVPKFSRDFMEKLTRLFYKMNSGTNMLAEKFPSSQHFLLPQKYKRETMLKIKDQVTWFGSFNISSLFFKNNIQTIFLFLALLIKIGMPLVINQTKFCPQFIKSKIPENLELYQIFLMELIGFQFFMAISAACNILNIGFIESSAKIDSLFHVMTLWCSLMVYPMYFFVSVKIGQKKVLKKLQKFQTTKKTQPVQKSIKTPKKVTFPSFSSEKLTGYRIRRRIRRIYSTQLYTILQYIFLPILPFVIQVNAPFGFLCLVCTILIFRTYWFYKHFKVMSMESNEKVFAFINIVFWFLLQIVYCTFYFISLLNNQQVSKHDYYDGVSKVFGFFSAFVVSFGGVFQVLRNLTSTLKFIVLKIVSLVKQKCKKISNKENRIADCKPKKKSPNFNPQTLKHSKSLNIQHTQVCEIKEQEFYQTELKRYASQNTKKSKVIHVRNLSDQPFCHITDKTVRKLERDRKREKEEVNSILARVKGSQFVGST